MSTYLFALLLALCTNAEANATVAGPVAARTTAGPGPDNTAQTGEQAPPAKAKSIKTTKRSKAKKRRTKSRRRGGCRATAPSNYRKMVRNWQKVPRIPKPRYRAGYRDLALYSVNLRERVRVFPFLPDGTLDPDAVAEIETLFRDKHTNTAHPVDPRLIKLMYRLADQLGARQVTIISGFRESAEPGGGGHHGDGSAVDLMVPGTPLARVAKVARRYGHVGVGFYPTSGFIHLDVRQGRSYFWADRSGPGQRSCLRQIMPQSAITFDRRWRPDQDEPKLHKNKRGELLGALPEPTEAAPHSADDEADRQPADAGP